GMRPGELVIMRGCDIDMTGSVWLYHPQRHKTAHLGHERVVPIGPRAQGIIRRHLKTDIQAFLFSPRNAFAEQMERKRAGRKTPPWRPQAWTRERNRLRLARRGLGERYDVHAYALAVTRACRQAFPPPAELGPKVLLNGKPETKRAWMARL